jgi:hypothetical protein
MTALGHLRRFERRPDTSGLAPIPDVMLSRSKERSGPISDIALQKKGSPTNAAVSPKSDRVFD